jgi:hypothetical protein
MRIFNVHERWIRSSIESAGELIDSLAGDDDRLWPWENWPAQKLDRPLAVGAKGGHGPIHYEVDAFSPGRLVHYEILPPTGFVGSHWFAVDRCTESMVLFRHVINARAGFCAWLRWAIIIRRLHDAVIEDAFDKAERALIGGVENPARWSIWVRFVRWLMGRRRDK